MKKKKPQVITAPIGNISKPERAFVSATSRFQPQLGQYGVLIASEVAPWQRGQGGLTI
ncbi:MAG: hypothetical protein WCA00_04865 [Candidatus Acidiferrales bacterium]